MYGRTFGMHIGHTLEAGEASDGQDSWHLFADCFLLTDSVTVSVQAVGTPLHLRLTVPVSRALAQSSSRIPLKCCVVKLCVTP